MTQVKRVLVYVLLGAIIGEVVATFISPALISWWNTPGAGASQTICDYPAIFRHAIDMLIRAQLIGAGVGAAVFLVVGILIARATARRARSATTAVAPR